MKQLFEQLKSGPDQGSAAMRNNYNYKPMAERSQTSVPIVTLLPIVVGNALSCALCFATWTMQLS